MSVFWGPEWYVVAACRVLRYELFSGGFGGFVLRTWFFLGGCGAGFLFGGQIGFEIILFVAFSFVIGLFLFFGFRCCRGRFCF